MLSRLNVSNISRFSLLFQACRGDKEDRGIKTRAGIKEMCSSPLPQPFLPVETDIFIAQPSAPEHKSYRSGDENGSFFIQYLANRFNNFAAHLFVDEFHLFFVFSVFLPNFKPLSAEVSNVKSSVETGSRLHLII